MRASLHRIEQLIQQKLVPLLASVIVSCYSTVENAFFLFIKLKAVNLKRFPIKTFISLCIMFSIFNKLLICAMFLTLWLQ